MKSNDLRTMYLEFFKKYNHKVIPSASVIPENDPTVLFTMAGMHPLVPYLSGKIEHPLGNRLCDAQKCIRTGDIDSVGDSRHLTFFEMMGNWSIGDYFKEESIKMSFEFLTSKEYLNIPVDKLYFSCFAGDDVFPKDIVAHDEWLKQGVDESHIFYLPKENNFWILASGIGPCGPDTEIFYDTGKEACCPNCSPACDCGKYVEIWNNVFMEFYKDENGNVTKLPKQNVDTGLGLERVLMVLNGYETVYEIDLFSNVKKTIEEITGYKYENYQKEFRIIMDHIRTSTFILGDDHLLVPSNIGAGYVLRKLIRRSVRNLLKLNAPTNALEMISSTIIEEYKNIYPELLRNKEHIITELKKEYDKFNKTIKDGEKLFYKVIKQLNNKMIDGANAFKLFDTFGFPLELTIDLANENGFSVDEKGFYDKYKEHQEKSKTIDVGSFKGGLADNSFESTKYHTLAHILLATLQNKYGQDVIQKGCNITPERIRFDFNLDHKMTDDEKHEVERKVNEVIKRKIPVIMEEMPFKTAKEKNVHGTFENKYGDIVKVYSIGDYSKEICGGPHVENTGCLGTFRITKEESSSAGVRRIKGILE